MLDKLIPQLGAEIAKLGDAAGQMIVTSMPYLLRQNYFYATTDLVLAVMFLYFAGYNLWLASQWNARREDNTLAVLGFLCFVAMGGALLIAGLYRVWNPEISALKDGLNILRGQIQ